MSLLLFTVACATTGAPPATPALVENPIEAPEPLVQVEAPPAPVNAMEVASAALMPFRMELMRTLGGAMEEGGPVHAIDTCNTQAQAVTASHQGEVTLGRTSNRLRSPANTPQEWVAPILEAFAAAEPAELAPVVVELDDGGWGYAEPILLAQDLCLNCHGTKGEQISDEVQAILDERYPDDAATGYSVGDFRGIFWARGAGVPLMPEEPAVEDPAVEEVPAAEEAPVEAAE